MVGHNRHPSCLPKFDVVALAEGALTRGSPNRHLHHRICCADVGKSAPQHLCAIWSKLRHGKVLLTTQVAQLFCFEVEFQGASESFFEVLAEAFEAAVTEDLIRTSGRERRQPKRLRVYKLKRWPSTL